jgi:hypothetical protein
VEGDENIEREDGAQSARGEGVDQSQRKIRASHLWIGPIGRAAVQQGVQAEEPLAHTHEPMIDG